MNRKEKLSSSVSIKIEAISLIIIFITPCFRMSGQTSRKETQNELVMICFLLSDIRKLNNINQVVIKTSDWQLADGNYLKQVENGERNKVSIHQTRGSNNKVKVIQKGNDNTISNDILYSDCLISAKWGILQAGSENYGEIDQWGSLQHVDFCQYGNGNDISIKQDGTPNGIMLENGFTNFASISQIGYGNKATVIQIYP